MKKIFKIIVLLLFSYISNAQSPEINLKDDNGHPIQEAYYKDIDNLLNQFEGTYLYTNGTTSLRIIFQKKTMSYDGYKYEDVLIGEYQYIENGVEKSNTLNMLTTFYSLNENEHSFHLNGILQAGDYLCQGCTANETRLFGGLVEHSTNNWAEIHLAKITVNGQPAIKMFVWWQMSSRKETDPPSAQPSFMGGDWVLIKQ